MANPRELLLRAAQNRRAIAVQAAHARADAAPREGAGAAEPNQAEPAPHPGARSAAQSHSAAYEALMRSHDRVRARHLPVQGGGDRA